MSSPPPAAFVTREYVRWGDIDIVGILRYDAILRFFTFGESELLRATGARYQDVRERFGVTLPRKVMHAEFHSPARLDELLEIRTTVSAVGTTSMMLSFDVAGDGGSARASGYLVLVCVDAKSFAKRALPPELIEAFAPYRVPNERVPVPAAR
jgi:YbgC/YbaW family acyl-CoA thioester hydrolase